ncbi:MAG: hypothetical protein Fues2KO_34650 [Fuerstiella sp.]
MSLPYMKRTVVFAALPSGDDSCEPASVHILTVSADIPDCMLMPFIYRFIFPDRVVTLNSRAACRQHHHRDCDPADSNSTSSVATADVHSGDSLVEQESVKVCFADIFNAAESIVPNV